MQAYCDFHPQTEAGWHCPQCQQLSCERCLQSDNKALDNFRCPDCGYPVSELMQARPEAKIYWDWSVAKRFLFSWPFICLLSLNLTLAGLYSVYDIALQLGLILLAFPPLIAALVFARTTLESYERKAPLVLDVLDLKSVTGHCALIAIAIGVGFWAWQLEYFVFTYLWGFMLAALSPGAAFLYLKGQVAIEEPSTMSERAELFWFVAKAGVVFVTLTWGALSVLYSHVAPQYFMPSASGLMCFAIVILYLVPALNLVAFETRNLARKVLPLSEHEKRDELIQRALKTGRFDEVRARLVRECYRSDSPDYRFVQLHRFLMFQNDWYSLAEHSSEIARYFLKRGRDEEAFELLNTLRRELKDFQVNDLALVLRLSKRCAHGKRYGLLLWLAKDAHERFPEERLRVAELYLRVSRILRDQYDEPERAQGFARYAKECVSQYELDASAQKAVSEEKSFSS